MSSLPYAVAVIVDPEYAGDLEELLRREPVWIVDTPGNRAMAEETSRIFPGRSHLDGITLFKSLSTSSAEDRIVLNIDTIDLHHGVYSADPPYTMLEVIGTPLTARIEDTLAEFGFNGFHPTVDGFRATRPLPEYPDGLP